MNKLRNICLLLMLAASLLEAQPLKYFVAFSDKDNNGYTLKNPAGFLSQQAVSRRSNYNIRYDASDLPVRPDYVAQVANIPNVTVMYALKWLNGVVVRFDSTKYVAPGMQAIDALPFVVRTEKVRRSSHMGPPPATVHREVTVAFSVSSAQAAYQYGRSFWQNRQLNVDCLHEQGYRGQGMTIAVMDIGFSYVPENPVFDSLRAYGNILGTVDFVKGGRNAYTGGEHGTMVLSCLAANIPGLIMGSAPLAKYWLLRTEEGEAETISEEYNWIRAAEFADSAGADILTTSLGYTEFNDPAQNHEYGDLNGRTAPMSIAATMAARKGMFVLNSAGNEGASQWRHIVVAADADSICAVGAIDSVGTVASFSSVGPTSDGRIKPDLVARGAGAWVSTGNGACFPASGTSFSAPIMAGAVACFWQKHRKLHNIKVLRTLRQVASNRNQPNNSAGWGVPDMCAALPASKPEFDFTWWADPAASAIRVNIADGSYEFIRISLYDLLGRTLMQKEAESNDLTFSFSSVDLTDNIYLLKIETSEGTRIKKIVKQ